MRREWRKRARFAREAGQPRRVPAAALIAPRTLTGQQVVEDAYFKSVHINPKDTSTDALTLTASDATWAGTLFKVVDALGVIQFHVSVAGVPTSFSVMKFRQTGDADDRTRLTTSSALLFGDGTNTPDWQISRTAANEASLAAGDVLKGTFQDSTGLGFARGLTSAAAAVTVSASTTRSAAVTYTIPASTATAGQTYRARVFGRATCPSDATPTAFPVEFRVATTAITTLSLIVPSLTAVTNANWEAEFYFTIRTIGAGGTCIAHGMGSDRLDLTSLTNSLVHAGTATETAIDTTASKAIDVAIACGEATVGYAITVEVGTIELVKP